MPPLDMQRANMPLSPRKPRMPLLTGARHAILGIVDDMLDNVGRSVDQQEVVGGIMQVFAVARHPLHKS